MNRIINWIRTGDAELNYPLDDYDRERHKFHWIALVVTLAAWFFTIYAIV